MGVKAAAALGRGLSSQGPVTADLKRIASEVEQSGSAMMKVIRQANLAATAAGEWFISEEDIKQAIRAERNKES